MTYQGWLALAVIALGTAVMRIVPLLMMQRRLSRHADRHDTPNMPGWLTLSGPLLIAALLGVSLAPDPSAPADWLATLTGVLATLMLWYRQRGTGWPIVVGVVAYGVVLKLAGG